jgi:hypothetical protein
MFVRMDLHTVIPMKTPTAVLVVASAMCLAIAPVRTLAGQDDRPADGHWSCFSGYEDNPIYVTPVWDARATAYDVGAKFREMLATKYNYKGRVSCGRADIGGSTLAGLQAGKEQEQAQWRKNGKTIVQTGWTLGATNAAPSSVGQPAPNPPAGRSGGTAAPSSAQSPTMYELCRQLGRGDGLRGTTGVTVYFSGIMERGNVNDEDFVKGFSAFLGTKYGRPNTTPECGAYPSQAEAQKAIDTWMAGSTVNKYVQTGWTYSPKTP